jgi:hypothetical protein
VASCVSACFPCSTTKDALSSVLYQTGTGSLYLG